MGLFSGLNDCIAEDNAQHISMWSMYLKVLASSFVITIGRPGHSHWWKTQMSGWPGGLGRGLGELASTRASWRSRFLGNRPWDGCLGAGGFPGSASEIWGEGWKQYQIVATEALRSLIWSSGAETVLQRRHNLTRLVRPLYVLCTDQSRVTALGEMYSWVKWPSSLAPSAANTVGMWGLVSRSRWCVSGGKAGPSGQSFQFFKCSCKSTFQCCLPIF